MNGFFEILLILVVTTGVVFYTKNDHLKAKRLAIATSITLIFGAISSSAPFIQAFGYGLFIVAIILTFIGLYILSKRNKRKEKVSRKLTISGLILLTVVGIGLSGCSDAELLNSTESAADVEEVEAEEPDEDELEEERLEQEEVDRENEEKERQEQEEQEKRKQEEKAAEEAEQKRLEEERLEQERIKEEEEAEAARIEQEKLEEEEAAAKNQAPQSTEEEIVYFLNQASTSQLQLINGIGPAYSEDIVNYRNNNGGFTTPEQVTNISGIAQDVLENLYRYFGSEGNSMYEGRLPEQTPPIVTKDAESEIVDFLNTASSGQLQNIKGVGEKKANDIIQYRNNNGGFSSSAEITNISGIADAILGNLRGYFE